MIAFAIYIVLSLIGITIFSVSYDGRREDLRSSLRTIKLLVRNISFLKEEASRPELEIWLKLAETNPYQAEKALATRLKIELPIKEEK